MNAARAATPIERLPRWTKILLVGGSLLDVSAPTAYND
jgi:hypothetical protein